MKSLCKKFFGLILILMGLMLINSNISFASCPPHTYIYESQGNGRHTILCGKCGTRFGQGTCSPAPPESCKDCGNGGSGGGEDELEVECEHEYGDWKIYPSDRTKHIHYCIFGCESYETESHSFGFLSRTCVCGLRKDGTCKHKYSSWEKIDNHNHKQTCLNDCGYYAVESHSYNIFGNCKCGTKKQENCDHTFTSWIYTEPTSHSRNCTKCPYRETQNHMCVWAIEEMSTCTKEGTKIYKCAYCSYIGDKGTDTIPKRPHSYNDLGICTECGFENKLEAKCTESRRISTHSYTRAKYTKIDDNEHEISETCNTCNVTFTRREGHVTSESNVKCVCGYVDTKICSHVYGSWADDGGTGHTRKCIKCQKAQTLPHVYIWKVTTKPTCTTEGIQVHECIYCHNIDSSVESEKLSKLEHIFNSLGKCLLCGTQDDTKARCTNGNKINGHVYGSASYKITSAETHMKTETCRTCNVTLTYVESHTIQNNRCTVCRYSLKCSKDYVVPGHNIALRYQATGSEKDHYEIKYCTECNVDVSKKESKSHEFVSTYDSEKHSSSCNLCGKVVSGKHQYTTTYTPVDMKTHKYIKQCKVCTYIHPDSRGEAHSGNGTKCSDCGMILKCSSKGTVDGHPITETYEQGSSSSSHYITRKCEKCNVVVADKKSEKCTFELIRGADGHTQKCTKCLKEISKSHEFKTTYERIDNNSHKVIEICECGEKKEKTEGHTMKNNSCRYCDAVLKCSSSGIVDGHSIITTYKKYDKDKHLIYESCPICDVNISNGKKVGHNFTSKTTSSGYVKTCENCGEVVSEKYDMTTTIDKNGIYGTIKNGDGSVTSTVRDDSVFELHQIHVGSGAAYLLRCGETTIVIDGGIEKREGLVLDYLEGVGVETLDSYIATHYDTDHVDNAIEILEAHGADSTTVYAPSVERDEKRLGTTGDYTQMLDGGTYTVGGITIKCVGPSAEKHKTDGENNPDSLNMLIEFGGQKILLTGDYLHDDVVEQYGDEIKDVTYLQFPHHGLDSDAGFSISPEAYAAINPTYTGVNANSHGDARRFDEKLGVGAEFYSGVDGNVIFTVNADGETSIFTNVKVAE